MIVLLLSFFRIKWAIPPQLIIGKCKHFPMIKTEKPVSFDFSVERDEHITRGSTLFGADMHPLHLMITESPCRIKAARRWSSDNNPAGCSHLFILLCSHFTAYSSLQRFLPVIIALENALSRLKLRTVIYPYRRQSDYNVSFCNRKVSHLSLI